jgi:nucleoside-diphosphate kinase
VKKSFSREQGIGKLPYSLLLYNGGKEQVERTLILIKPDGVQRGLIGEIIGRIEKRGLKLAGLKLMQVSKSLAEQHYAEHKERSFFGTLVNFVTSGPLVAMAVEGPNAIAVMRKMMGSTNPQDAVQGTIRGDFALTMAYNIIHGSDGPESAARELKLFFKEEELVTYARNNDAWIF